MTTLETDRYGAVEKCRAVLAVWTERQTAAAIARELGVSATLFCQWQDRALMGMLEALEARGARERAPGPALPTLVKRLLDRKARARELATLGQHARVRPRTVRQKAPPPPAATS